MRLGLGYAVSAVLAATVPGTAAAQAGPVNYGCSAPLAQGGNVQVQQPGPTYRVRGRLEINEVETFTDPFQSERPAADVKVLGSDGHTVIMLYVLPRLAVAETDQVADIAVRQIIPGGGDERPMGTISRGEGGWAALAFDIEAQADRVIVTAGSQREEFAMRIGPNATIEMACVGGGFAFVGVDWGRERGGLIRWRST